LSELIHAPICRANDELICPPTLEAEKGLLGVN
jgi:hypothetical protein